ncbi:RIMS-binding protein 2 isoform c [Homo sapiens]|uniref:RIMS-binding protein 2 n=1 Tax=Homo sapiens TaxID=9606 RepID=A0A9L9PY66_HUMAN|nr:RIMS-binding protein 2 isoform c [Homo sapiens]NP_001380549.1 RIMS-binding protein 2 isoform c [Homo sapiens]NP_001380550.1 RIMS-binding protein 2 isoform c [Homo sapiens]NP_001380551.1 RIMS-binding protein 2 isoform c [Homo sapiens]NP_001380552.1 RIMS-binding protein 2 isoform c [Homo sapiens]|eukprot:NP_001338159.1 RIMS-binding protein 2 isoform c [Homo sapiens]
MREAAERRQQLQLEHDQALAVLSAKQQEIDLLQKAQVEAKKEHEGAVRLLESKVRELEEKCRTQSEQFNLLSRDLEKFRQHAGKIDLLGGSAVAPLDISTAPSKPFPQFMNGLATSLGKGQESAIGGSSAIGEYIRPLPQPGDRPEPLSAKPTFLSRSGSARCRSESDMENERNSNTSKQRYSGKVHLCVARYSYNPFDGPNENPEAELPLTAGKYLYVYGDMDEDGFYEGELLDGQRGLVPSNFVDFVQDNESRLASTLGNEQDQNFINHSGIGLEGEHILDLHSPTHIDAGITDNSAGTLDVNIDDIGEDIVPYPRKITLIKQLAKSVIVGWEPPAVPPGWGTVSSYNVLVDKETRMNLTLGSRTKALIEKLNMAACTYRISVQCVTSRGSSDELQCTLLVGKDVVVAPSHLRVDNITQISAQLSWLPTNSNYSHVIFLNEEEFDIVKAARYKYQFFNLRPNMAYKVKVLAKPHQMPWQLPLEQREKKEAFVEFSTLPAGPPAPPQDVTVQAGVTPATIRVSWRPPVLTPTGLSNGANVTGYGVYAKGQRVAEVIFPTADSTAVELVRLRSLEAKGVTVRTLSAQGESVDSAVAAVPPELLVPPTPHPRPAPQSKPLASSGVPETKDEHLGPHARMDEAWEQSRAPGPVHGHMLEPPVGPGRRSPSPSRILPQPQGTPVSTTVAKAMAREAAQRVAESSRLEKRSVFLERSSAGQYAASDEEDAYDSPDFKRRGASVDDFLKGSELGKQPHCCHGDEYHTESSRGSDLSDIMEEDEEELYSEMQLEDGGRRRPSGTSHNALKILGNPASAGRVDHMGRRFPRGSAGPQRSRPVTVPSIDDYGRDRLSPDFYEESETDPGAEELPARIFVALFDYDPLTMSPNPDAAEEELPFKEGQIIKVYGDKDADGFYRGETCARLGLIPCNMVSEIQADDEEMMDQLLRQGFLPLNTPVEKIERSRRSGRRHSVSTRRMVALYDYDPRESSPNVDVEAELTFCTGDIITVFGEIDEDGFYYGELNGQKGLVPSNFLEEVPDDVEVYLSDAPSHYSQDTPMRSKAKRKKSVHFTP